MSQGSLNPIQYKFDDDNNFVCEILAMVDGTLGAWAQSVIDASHGTIQNGDQITIITLEGDNIMAPWPKTVRVVLDTTATEEAEAALSAMGINISPDGVINSGDGFYIFGAAVILSRPEIAQTTGALTWKRSTQRMAVNYGDSQVRSLFTQTAYNAAVRSYTKSGNRDIQSDYYLNQGKRNAAGMNIPDAPIPAFPFLMTNTNQCTNEDISLYGKYGAVIVDPADGKRKLVADFADNKYTVSSWAQSGQGSEGAAPEPAGELFAQQAVNGIPFEWGSQYDVVISHNEAISIAETYGVNLSFVPRQ